MRKRIRVARDFFLGLAVTPINRGEQELVAGFFSEYQPLNTREALRLERELGKAMPDMAGEKAMQLTNPFIELGIQRDLHQGLQKGIVKGRRQGGVELVLRLLKRRLGALPGSQEKAARKLELSRIEALGTALLELACRADLVIAILSPGTRSRDLEVKRKIYAVLGVQEYWIVDPEAATTEVLISSELGYVTAGVYGKADRLSSPLLPNLNLPLSEVFA